MIIKKFLLFLETILNNTARKITSWYFLKKVLNDLKGEMPQKLVELVFFWDDIYSSYHGSFYNYPRVETEIGTKKRQSHLRVANHWNWRDEKGNLRTPVCDENENIDSWLCGKWVENNPSLQKIDSEFKHGFINNIDSNGCGFITPSDGSEVCWVRAELIEQGRLAKNDIVYFKSVPGFKRPSVTEIYKSQTCYKIIDTQSEMIGYENIKNILNKCRSEGYHYFIAIVNTGKLEMQDSKVAIKTNEGWEDIKAVKNLKPDYLINNKLKIDDKVKLDFRLRIKDKTWNYQGISFNELKAEIYRLKRIKIDKSATFQFSL